MRGFPLPANLQMWLDDPMILCTAGRKEVEITKSVPARIGIRLLCTARSQTHEGMFWDHRYSGGETHRSKT